ncbi:hypothetical protein [Streptomyces sp. WG-D5]
MADKVEILLQNTVTLVSPEDEIADHLFAVMPRFGYTFGISWNQHASEHMAWNLITALVNGRRDLENKGLIPAVQGACGDIYPSWTRLASLIDQKMPTESARAGVLDDRRMNRPRRPKPSERRPASDLLSRTLGEHPHQGTLPAPPPPPAGFARFRSLLTDRCGIRPVIDAATPPPLQRPDHLATDVDDHLPAAAARGSSDALAAVFETGLWRNDSLPPAA